MATAPRKRITAWSFSRFGDYDSCPLKAYLKHVEKIKEPGSAAMDRGSEIHTKCEHYIVGALPRIPAELKEFADEFRALRKMYKDGSKLRPMAVEDTWAFTSDWQPCRWDDWNNCWVRIKLDCAHFEPQAKGCDDYVLIVTDFKTGKFRPDQNEEYVQQLELYALGALLTYNIPSIVVKPRLMYLDAGTVYPEKGSEQEAALTYTQKDVPGLKKLWERRTKAMLNDVRFAPKPGNGCRWCHFKRTSSGHCKF